MGSTLADLLLWVQILEKESLFSLLLGLSGILELSKCLEIASYSYSFSSYYIDPGQGPFGA